MERETILDILINGCEISQHRGEVVYEYNQEQFEQVVKKLVNKTNDIHSVSYCECTDSHKITMTTRKCIACNKLVYE